MKVKPDHCSIKNQTPPSPASLDLQSGCWLWWPGVTRECPHSPPWPPGPGDQATVRRPPPAPSGRQNCHGVNEWNTFSLYRPDHLLNFYQSRYLHYTTTHLLNTTFHFSLALTQNQKHFRSFSWDTATEFQHVRTTTDPGVAGNPPNSNK